MYNIQLKFGIPKKLVRLIKTCLDETQSEVKIENYLSSSFFTENGLKQGYILLPLLFNFSLECAIWKVQDTNFGLDTNDTHQVLGFTDDVNLIGNDIKSIERTADILLNACKDIALAVNIGKSKYME